MKKKTMRGDLIDMAVLKQTQGHRIAVGNTKKNGRGDLIGKKGQVIKTQEAISAEYHAHNPKAVARSMPIRNITAEALNLETATPAETAQALRAKQAAHKDVAEQKATAAHADPHKRAPRKIVDGD